ncbi:MAG TPA: trypsin-like peptidase domain-containing protein [Gaiellaceae bacterium]|nr:trypsin-like peptidase domain-containing protein [Gaiellaceae bacterium]
MNERRNRIPLLLAGIVAALGIGVGAGATTYAVLMDEPQTVVRQVTVTSSEPTAATDALTVGEIYERARAGVVKITVSGGSPTLGRSRAQGSGFVIDRDGHIVTNQHVVSGGGTITVHLANRSTYRARLVGSDRSTDLAVLRIDAPAAALEPLQLGDSSEVAVGDTVVAIGSPFGLDGTVTSGIVSALHRQMTAPNDFTITDAIQTDAAINHGNSGGPLLDGRGRVIGVNTQIESESGGNVGIGFAVPSNTVRAIAGQLIESGQAEHAYLGITMLTVTEGVAVTEVRSATPAEDAGLRAATGSRTVDGQEVPTGGDVIVAVDGKEISSSSELQSAVDAKRPGDTVSITVLRDGERRTVEVTLGTRPS